MFPGLCVRILILIIKECLCIEALGYILSAAKIAECPIPGEGIVVTPNLDSHTNNTARYMGIMWYISFIMLDL